ncbi:dTDP-4-dehydrorhamnose 3,5-epimerase [Balneicella halophila]|uniref:dTDP-4-dehydrorhamnose 3,5-epimerase n=1 Tax=Balneicella halophila TaxID=1537566 RepID=A0A7L4UNT9_BALHA|nr:dTDP-4-dehydrorhamnose 3,5-epimerase [Balneicella halophila]PVX50758.1 dTDP-4-dehydrorhamnose 3,5-epimerase [Balneicella halophila]
MKIVNTSIEGVKIFIPTVFTDNRGYFAETFREEIIHKETNTTFIQENESFSKKGVLRGLHYQQEPYAQAKLVRCVLGEVYDVAVDLRKSSLTFGKYIAEKLSGENKKQLFIPRGFAHGFVVLSDWAIVVYKVDNYYHKESEVTICYNDDNLNIDWGLSDEDFILSEKDKNGISIDKVPLF